MYPQNIIVTDSNKDINMENNKNIPQSLQGNSTQIISFFDKDSDFVFVYKKTEKLTTAIYLVTNLFSDNEPIKWSLRKKSNDILSFMLDYKNIVSHRHADFSSELKMKVLEIVSLLEIASRSGIISSMNFSIINQEFSSLLKTVDGQDVTRKENQSQNLSQSFFYIPKTEPKIEQQNEEFVQPSAPVYKYDAPKSVQPTAPSPIKIAEEVSDNNPFKRTNRQEAILNLLRKKGDLNIKDISLVIRGCGEKTIQRELVSLISTGLIKKEGERRWSRYSIK